ncbi:MAG: hypothetical protein ACE5IM_12200 [Nitrospinota bacterium]
MSSWIVGVDDIPEEGLEFHLFEEPGFFDFEYEGCSWRGPVEWDGHLQRFGKEVDHNV